MTVFNQIDDNDDDETHISNFIGESTLSHDFEEDGKQQSSNINKWNLNLIRDTIRSTSTDLRSSPSVNSAEFKKLIANAKLQQTMTEISDYEKVEVEDTQGFSSELSKTVVGSSETGNRYEDHIQDDYNYEHNKHGKDYRLFEKYDMINDTKKLSLSENTEIANDESKWEDINDDDDDTTDSSTDIDHRKPNGKNKYSNRYMNQLDEKQLFSNDNEKLHQEEYDDFRQEANLDGILGDEKDVQIIGNRKIKVPKNRIHKKNKPSLQSIAINHRPDSIIQQNTVPDSQVRNNASFKSGDVKLHTNNNNDNSSSNNNIVELPSDDRGRLYIKIIGLKNLTLPEIDNHDCKFSILLDNGIHCISTPKVPLLQSSKIDQEFELTVGGGNAIGASTDCPSSLEFILTCKIDFENGYKYHDSSAKNDSNKELVENKLIEITESLPIKKKRWGGLLGSKTIYKTRKRIISSNEQGNKSEKIDTKQDPWSQLTAKDGSFARSYIDFDQYEPIITGKACNFDVTCFNEWEIVQDDHENGGTSKRKFYRIGKLEVQMLFIPRSKHNEIFPPSISVAFHSMEQYQLQLSVKHEGYLLQYGGDCSYLKKRYFNLLGTDLIAHNAQTKKTRIKINLIKAVSIILKDETNKNSQNRSHNNHYFDGESSDHNYGDNEYEFLIKFINGEFITFVAASAFEKLNWLRCLNSVISRNKYRQPWVKIMCEQN